MKLIFEPLQLNVSLDHPFFINVINSKRSSFIKKFSYFAMANNRSTWALNAGLSNPTETNAQYNPKLNQMCKLFRSSYMWCAHNW